MRRIDRPARVVGAGQTRQEDGDDPIAQHPIDGAAEAPEHVGGDPVEASHDLAEGGGGEPLPEGGRAAHVGEEDRHLELATPCWQGVQAIGPWSRHHDLPTRGTPKRFAGCVASRRQRAYGSGRQLLRQAGWGRRRTMASLAEPMIGAARRAAGTQGGVGADPPATGPGARVVVLSGFGIPPGPQLPAGLGGVVAVPILRLVAWLVWALIPLQVGPRLLPGPATQADMG